MRIATFNVNGVNGRLPVLLRWLEEQRPDIVCLQELKAPQERFPEAALAKAGHRALWLGQKNWLDDALFRPEVRGAFHELLAQGWVDAVRTLHPGERLYTFWDYFRNAWPRRAQGDPESPQSTLPDKDFPICDQDHSAGAMGLASVAACPRGTGAPTEKIKTRRGLG